MVLGLGLAVSVAPLTTVVMDSVSQERAGAASGINNAVARVAGLLAVAIFGIVMVKLFSANLNGKLAAMPLPRGVLQSIQSNEIKLGAMELPPGLEGHFAALIHGFISSAFVFAFRAVMLICAGLSVAGAFVSWLAIPSKSE